MINKMPGDDKQVFEDDLYRLLGRHLVLLDLEQRKNVALREAYSQLRVQLDSLKTADKDK